jgi:hypothetical protein
MKETSWKVYLRNKVSPNGKKYVYVKVYNITWTSEFSELDDYS